MSSLLEELHRKQDGIHMAQGSTNNTGRIQFDMLTEVPDKNS